MLYCLHFSSEGDQLTLEKIEGTLEKWNRRNAGSFILGSKAGEGVITPNGFRAALGRSVDLKLAHCDEAGREDGLVDSQLRSGTRWMVERTVGHLSSGGYKLARNAVELAALALGSDHDQLRRELQKDSVAEPAENGLLKLLLRMGRIGENSEDIHDHETETDEGSPVRLDLIDATRNDIANSVKSGPGAIGWANLLAKPDSQSFENDPGEVTSGYLFGLTPADVLIEEFRRFVFALKWMEESALVRIATPLDGEPMVSLIHDGFGTGLNRWAESSEQDPEGVLSALTAPRGFTFYWPDRGLLPAIFEDESDTARNNAVSREDAVWSGTHRVLTNLRWQYGTVEKTPLDRIAFLNCDFQGLQVQELSFEASYLSTACWMTRCSQIAIP